MKNLWRYTAHLSTAMLLAGILVGCGAATTPGAAGPIETSAQAAQLAPSPTTAVTVEPMRTAAPTATVEPTRTSTAESTSTPPTASTATEQPVAVHAAAHGTTVEADIKLFAYQPDPLKVQPGTTVVWTNQDDIEHSVTYGPPPAAGQSFASGLFGKGRSFSFTFAEPGEYLYFCLRHNSMVGVVRVTGN